MWNLLFNAIFAVILVGVAIGVAYAIFKVASRGPTQSESEPNPKTEDTRVEPKEARFTMFYVNWCPHCKKAKPIWQLVHNQLDGQQINGYTVTVDSVNCEADKRKAKAYKVKAYPTFKLTLNDTIITYRGPPIAETLKLFVKTALGAVAAGTLQNDGPSTPPQPTADQAAAERKKKLEDLEGQQNTLLDQLTRIKDDILQLSAGGALAGQ